MSQEDKEVIELWNSSVKKVDGHYMLPIPFKNNPPHLRNNCVANVDPRCVNKTQIFTIQFIFHSLILFLLFSIFTILI